MQNKISHYVRAAILTLLVIVVVGYFYYAGWQAEKSDHFGQRIVHVWFLNEKNFDIGKEPYESRVERRVPTNGEEKRQVLEQLMLGPSSEEKEIGLSLVRSGVISLDFSYDADSEIAWVGLVGICNSGGSTYTIANLINKNLEQFSDIEQVVIYDDGLGKPSEPTEGLPGCLEP